MPNTKPKNTMPRIPVAHLREFSYLLDAHGTRPFRLSDLTELLLKHVRPRTTNEARIAADRIFKAAARRGEIVREGHLHWVAANKGNSVTLLSGRNVPCYEKITTLTVSTHKPEKWVFVDLENGNCFSGNSNGVLSASSQQVISEVAAIISKRGS